MFVSCLQISFKKIFNSVLNSVDFLMGGVSEHTLFFRNLKKFRYRFNFCGFSKIPILEIMRNLYFEIQIFNMEQTIFKILIIPNFCFLKILILEIIRNLFFEIKILQYLVNYFQDFYYSKIFAIFRNFKY